MSRQRVIPEAYADGESIIGDGSIGNPLRVGGGISATVWQLVVDNPLTSLTGLTARTGVWTLAGPGGCVQCDSGTAEGYLSIETAAALEAVPFPTNNFIAQVELAWTAAAGATNDSGFVVYGAAAAIANGAMRTFVRRDGSVIGSDIFGAANQQAVNPALGVLTTDVFRTFRIEVSGTITARFGDPLATWVTSRFNTGTNPTMSFPATRIGLWSNPGRCAFRNLKVWRLATPVS